MMLVGPTGGGKSTIINTFIDAQSHIGIPSKLTILNPKVLKAFFIYIFF